MYLKSCLEKNLFNVGIRDFESYVSLASLAVAASVILVDLSFRKSISLIIPRPFVTIKYLKKNSNKEFITNFVEKKKEKRTLLYVSKNEKEKIINAIEERTNIKVMELN